MALRLKLDFAHDLSISDGVIETVEDGDFISQSLKTRLKTMSGEVILDNTYGFQYKKLFESRRLDLSILESLIKKYILETYGVVRITKFLLSSEGGNSRKLLVTFTVATIYSEFVSLEVSLDSWNTI